MGGVEGTPIASDIAVHAGRICRYGGAIWMPLLAHLVFVGLLAFKRTGCSGHMLWGFLHDAHEIITSDVPRPFKCDCMRAEQKAIDERLCKRFMKGHEAFVDQAVIKQCDIDALHIEATTLNLPDFAEVELQYAADYCNETKIHADRDDQSLFVKILFSPFYKNTIHGRQSVGVRQFADALAFAERENYHDFLEAVRGWDLLDIDKFKGANK